MVNRIGGIGFENRILNSCDQIEVAFDEETMAIILLFICEGQMVDKIVIHLWEEDGMIMTDADDLRKKCLDLAAQLDLALEE